MTEGESRNRSADAAIRGYMYQFDRTILILLDSSPEDTITVEGIEDIDLLSDGYLTAEQCKYWAGSAFSLSGIRDAVSAMLGYFADGRELSYRLYIHTSRAEDTPSTLSVSELKKCLTLVKRKSKEVVKLYEEYPETTLYAFSQSLRIVRGPDYETQSETVIDRLRSEMKCSIEECRSLYYPNARNAVITLATKSSIRDRQINRKRFLATFDHKKYLYTKWHAETVGLDRFASAVAKSLRRDPRMYHNRFRFLVVTLTDSSDVSAMVDLVRMLATKFYGPGKLHTAIPWTLIVDAPSNLMHDLKAHLAAVSIKFNDGYEDYNFNGEIFGSRPLIVRRGRSSVLVKCSFDVWLLSLQTYNEADSLSFSADIVLSHRGIANKIDPPIDADRVVEFGPLAIRYLTQTLGRVS